MLGARHVGGPPTIGLNCTESAIETAYAAALSCAGAKHGGCRVEALAAEAMAALRDFADRVSE